MLQLNRFGQVTTRPPKGNSGVPTVSVFLHYSTKAGGVAGVRLVTTAVIITAMIILCSVCPVVLVIITNQHQLSS